MGEEALSRLRTTEPVAYLAPSPELSSLTRAASGHLYSSLLPFCPSKPPLDHLLSDQSFDAEQIWSQIDLLSKPLLPFLRRQLSRLEKESKLQSSLPGNTLKSTGKTKKDEEEEEDNDEELGLGDEEEGDEDEDDEEEDDGEEFEDKDEEEGEDEKGEDEVKDKAVEDKFLKIKELEKFLEDGEAEEYGLPTQKKKIDQDYQDNGNETDQDEEDDDDDEEDALDIGNLDDDSEGELEEEMENARYEDFFGCQSNKGALKKSSRKKVKFDDRPQINEIEYEETDDEIENKEIEYQENDDETENNKKNMSTHEKEVAKLRSKIEEMERANLEPKSWTMIGEVTAAKRPVNSALEVDLDFEHNVRPAPVITEEVTASLEELIKKRIIDGQFDDVQRAPSLPSKAPRELKELDENKSKQGLAEIYEEEYAQKAGLATAPISVSDELKKEAEMLFKKICLKLDALSHFHFAPKPIIEDMSIQANVPALAMEEIAPIAVSDAAMLAPEEIFEGKGDVKDEKELTGADRKRRRANKKRRFKAESAKKPRPTTDANGQ
ncbi:U3 small nucleolar ribonucleoprotein MPP10 [Rhynchospora pubera]|uniref:U3 small nucleolar ribonucleoprotein protein MPP10 n=1 Tax=Rhynchospora pubera TaxID=906938 RepID=A0AAV8FA52_9POAL|nr:U3 small nucleolar ribonucleoprotein MPP10 [Rhynchospora pubera]